MEDQERYFDRFDVTPEFQRLLKAAERRDLVDSLSILVIGVTCSENGRLNEELASNRILHWAFLDRHHETGRKLHAELCRLNDERYRARMERERESA